MNHKKYLDCTQSKISHYLHKSLVRNILKAGILLTNENSWGQKMAIHFGIIRVLHNIQNMMGN